MNKEFKLLSVSFINGDYNDAFSRLKKGSFMAVPSGPGLSLIDKDRQYWNALKGADFAIPDSGFMIILARLFFGMKIKKLSGPKFLRLFLKENILKENDILFSVDPSANESMINNRYLNEIGISIKIKNHYVAPYYNKKNITDKKLIKHLEMLELKPKFILLNLGGGVQERLALYLKKNLSYKVGIICTGAAIAFETGQQARLPKWVDELFLGWFARIVQSPKNFTMRFLKAFRLVYVFYLFKINELK
jgi:N-acetylglucosaminyldiphosphoundecaprenol N-acetyl-beta-D-mannosaminyltransferase